MRALLLALPFCLLLSLLPGCSQPQLPFLGEDARVLAFGDSLTQGVGAAQGMDYPSRLALLCQCEVINAGVSGETTAEGAARLPEVLDETQPDLIILLEGGNDILKSTGKDALKANLATMLREAKQRSIPVLLVAVPDRQIMLKPLPLYRELADEFAVPLLEDTVAELLSQSAMKSDTVHFNDAGYHALAEQIHQLALESGAF